MVLALFQATTDGYCHYGLLIYAVEEVDNVSLGYHDEESGDEQHSRYASYLTLEHTCTYKSYSYMQRHAFLMQNYSVV